MSPSPSKKGEKHHLPCLLMAIPLLYYLARELKYLS